MDYRIPEFDPSTWEDVDLPIYRREIEPALPARIFDFHTHAWRRDDFAQPPSEETRRSSSLVFVTDHFPFSLLQETLSLLFPGKTWESLSFGFPFAEMDVDRNNRHIAEAVRENPGHSGLALVRPEHSSDQVRQQVVDGGFLGIKPYWAFVRGKAQNDVLLDDMLTEAHMQVADELGLIVLIHVPRAGRLPDPSNLECLHRLARQFPRARMVLAHVGRAYCEWVIEDGLAAVLDLPNLFFDTTFIQNRNVFRQLFRRFDASHVLYGSDLPNSAVHGQVVCVNGINLFVTRQTYPWSLSPTGNLLGFTYMAYESIRAILRGAGEAGLTAHDLEGVFYRNARELIDAVRRGLPRPQARGDKA
ncbi:MAG TPA: amidohydrolase family protein [Anaerolineales bacterium]|nr:amidohydrolase family protein [Anaerolineales bacterium]